MKRIAGGLLLAAGLAASAAEAVMLDPSGRGEVLIVPYYTVEAGQQTLLSVVNHAAVGKAVKLRVRESRNGREAFALNLYLGAFDVWTAALFSNQPAGPANLLTQDNSCTVPALRTSDTLPQLSSGVRYAPFRIDDFTGARSDGGSAELTRTREGYIELIEMGALVDGSRSALAAGLVAGVPRDCASLVQAWSSGGYWQHAPATDLQAPGGGLSASASVIDVASGALYSVSASALSQFSIAVQHSGPDALLPDLSSAVTDAARQTVESTVLAAGRVYRSHWPQARAIDAVSAALIQDEVSGELLLDPALDAQTAWVVTFPTKRHYTDPAIAVDGQILPFREWPLDNVAPAACQLLDRVAHDREAGSTIPPIQIGGTPPTNLYCGSLVRLEFLPRQLRLLLGSPLYRMEALQFNGVRPGGVARLKLGGYGHALRPSLGGQVYSGLPALGFKVSRYRNTEAQPGQLGIYSGAVPLSGSVVCSQGEQPCAPL